MVVLSLVSADSVTIIRARKQLRLLIRRILYISLTPIFAAEESRIESLFYITKAAALSEFECSLKSFVFS